MFFISTLSQQTALASSKPPWIKKIPQEKRYKFYVGYGTGKNEEVAIGKAIQDAYNQAIRQNFGVETKIDIQSKETMIDTIYTKSFKENSENVKFIGFDRRKIHIENKDNSFSVWILFRYSLKEINKERKRIDSIANTKKSREKNYIMGQLEYEKGNVKKTKKLWQKACDAGNMDGCNGLVWLERENKEKREILRKIRKVYRENCNRGNSADCYNLAWEYNQEKNITQAKIFFKNACDGGFIEGCSDLGNLEKKSGNVKKAKSLYQKACDGGGMGGCLDLEILKQMKYMEDNYSEKSIEKSCDGGDVWECFNLGSLEEKRGNIKKAKFLYQKACDGGLKWVCSVLEAEKAKSLYQKACDGGVMAGCYDLGILEEKSGNIKKAKSLYQKVCDKGESKACEKIKKTLSIPGIGGWN